MLRLDEGLAPRIRKWGRRHKVSTRVLIAEDDAQLAGDIAENLKRHGLEPMIVLNKDDALAAVIAGEAAVMVFARFVFGEDSLHMVLTMRKRGIVTPVLIIGAADVVAERVHGLRAGADDYLAKPFAMGELVARVDAIVRRLNDKRLTRLRAGPLEMDLIDQSLSRDGRKIDLTPGEFKMLLYFMRRPNEIVTREVLLKQVWGYAPERPTNAVDVQLGGLRRKLGAENQSSLIVSVRGAGFVLRVD